MQKLFPMYGIMSAELKFHPKELIRTENYDTAHQDLTRMSVVEVAIAICDTHGWRAHGKIWTFKINTRANSISLVMLPELSNLKRFTDMDLFRTCFVLVPGERVHHHVTS